MNIDFASCLLRLTIVMILATLVIGAKESNKTVMIDVESLPEPFQNNHLPSSEFDEEDKNETCYDLMGCYCNIPVFSFPSNPMDLRTVFTIKYKDQESDIVVEKSVNCLEKNPGKCEKYPFDLKQLRESPFRPDRRTIVIIGGYRSKTKGNWESRVAELWSGLDSVNVILVGWEEASNTVYYPKAAANSRPVARQLTVLLYYLAKLNGNLDLFERTFTERFYLIGHSLGAHVAGFVGSDLAGTLGRITGLDPAGISFDSLPGKYRIDKSDAQFVDIMHTNAGSKLTLKAQYGSAIDAGHIDFWANDGQHQPGCSTDILGCSHRLAGHYYVSFLKDVSAMRTYLGSNYKPMHRLRAYKGQSFNEFHDGIGLATYCPVATMDDNDLIYRDLDSCSIPIDFLAWPIDYRDELRVKHGLDFNASGSPNRFYFYTQAATSEQLDHYMIRVRVTKADNPSNQIMDKNSVVHHEGCSIGVKISMADGMDTSTKINSYKLINFEDHREVVFPFLASNSKTKYEIAQLDSQDFYVTRDKDQNESISEKNLELLRKAIDQVFPSSVSLNGFATDGDGKNQSLMATIKRWFRGRSEPDEVEDKTEDGPSTSNKTNCELPIESFIVQPLRKFRRHLSAFYKRNCVKRDQPLPEVNMVLLSKEEPSPKALLFDESATGCDVYDLKLTLDTIIIGPLQNVALKEEFNYGNLEQSSWADETSATNRHEDIGDAKHWLKLTVLLIFALSIVILVSVITMRRPKTNKLDRRNLILTTSTNPTYSIDC